MDETILETIEKQAGKLSLHDHIKLMEALLRQLKEKSITEPKELEWERLYGLGKGLWEDEDAQEYVNRLREDRL
jgi:hypothetical protein